MGRRQGRDKLITKLVRVIELKCHARRNTVGEQRFETTQASPIQQNPWFSKKIEQNLLVIAAQAMAQATNGGGVYQGLDHVPRVRATINIITKKNLDCLAHRALLHVPRDLVEDRLEKVSPSVNIAYRVNSKIFR